MADVTVCLLSWMRPGNLPFILDSIAAQSVETRIFLWDNGPEPVDDPRLDWRVDSSVNLGCWPRWIMATHAETEFVCSLDDDLCFGDRHVLRDGLRIMETLGPDQVVGPFARNLSKSLSYTKGRNIYGSRNGQAKNWKVDVIKGRHILARTEPLRTRLPPHLPPPAEDDIAVCGILAGGKLRQHVRPGIYLHKGQRFRELPAPHSLWGRPDHLYRRDKAAREFFHP